MARENIEVGDLVQLTGTSWLTNYTNKRTYKKIVLVVAFDHSGLPLFDIDDGLRETIEQKKQYTDFSGTIVSKAKR